ncbi:BMP family protein [Bacillus sp. AFS041924]|uniref:BMP family lipoprotein n=1 Tax=Bacillus sp. AFS041924 TaxID=2033503 RepID=UPI000BFD552E|nr:BMP family ABC transporter substrate-binding protein [Bacillus sp. AFS041924]PGS49554.1 BMP family ABC transporter substrate-binding protein [Bacillus sp. AFS041924]
MRKRFFQIATISIIASITLTSCSSRNNNISASEKEKEKDFKIGIVMGQTEINDKGFNQAVWEGIKKTGKKHNWKENKNYVKTDAPTDKDAKKELMKYAKKKYDLVFGIGYSFQKAIAEIASKEKKSDFVIIDGIVEKPNVVSVTYREEQSAFLAGIAAAMNTKTHKVGFIGGTKDPFIKRFEYGFKAGVMSEDPKIKVMTKFANSFDKPEVGSKLAKSLYNDEGVDIIFQVAGKTGLGVFTEAKKLKKSGKKIWVIGVDRDQYKEGLPENVTLTSAIKRIDKGVNEVITKKLKGNFQGGRILKWGIKENGVGLAKTDKNLNKDTKEQVKLYEANIRTGHIEVPKTKEEFDNFDPKKPEKGEVKKKKVKIGK